MVKATPKTNNRFVAFFEWLWFEYLIFTALYMLGTRERVAFSKFNIFTTILLKLLVIILIKPFCCSKLPSCLPRHS